MSEYIKKTDIANVIYRLEPDPDFQKKEHKFWEDISNEIFSIQGYRRAQPENKPLTLDELKQMDGEPVWVMHQDGSGARWGIVQDTEYGLCAVVDDDTAYWFTDVCGTIAYRYKPERSEGVMIKIPAECYKEFGADLDGCSTQEREGCGACHLAKRVSTNADRIRSMTDWGLARQNVRKHRGYCVWTTSDGREFTSYLGFEGGYRADEDTIALAVQHELDWLRQPAETKGTE